jgi:hypothetical protein
MNTQASTTNHEAAGCPTRHDTVATATVLAAIVLTVLYGVSAVSFDPAFDTTAVTLKESQHV